MKLLFFVEHFSLAGAGAENDAVQLCRALAKRGHAVHVCCDDGEAVGAVQVHTNLAAAADIIARVKPDKTIDWGFLHSADIYRLGGGLHQPYLDYYLRAFPAWWRPLKRIALRLAHKHRRQIASEQGFLRTPRSQYLAISQLVADQATASGCCPDSLHVVYNGVDAARFALANPAARARIRRVWAVKPTDTVFLFIAHNLRLKNLALLIEVFDLVSRDRDDLKLVVCGKRPPAARRPYLIHAGTTSAIEQFYAAADALLHPTYFDSFANVVLEAMAAGLPVAVSDCAGVAELIDDQHTGLVGPVRDQAAARQWWSATVRQLAACPARRRGLGQAAQAAARQLTQDKFVQAVEAFILEPKHG